MNLEADDDMASFWLCGDDLSKSGVSGGCYMASWDLGEKNIDGKFSGNSPTKYIFARKVLSLGLDKIPFNPFPDLPVMEILDKANENPFPVVNFLDYLRDSFTWGCMPDFVWEMEAPRAKDFAKIIEEIIGKFKPF